MAKPHSILFTIPNFITAGSGQVLVNIIAGLDKNLFAPVVCVEKQGGRLFQTLQEMQIPVLQSPFTVSIQPYHDLLFRAWKTAKLFRPYHFQIWHSFHYSDMYSEAFVAFFAGVRTWIYTKKSMAWGSRAWLLKSYLAHRVVVDNTDMSKYMFNRAGLGNKLIYIPHSVDIDKFRPGLPHQLGLRQEFNIAYEAPLIVCVAELLPVKGHPSLLQALVHIPNAHLFVAGRPMYIEYAESLKKLASELSINDRVHFMGGVSDIPALLAESDIFVLPTLGRGRMEGCPVALLEAMACGKACIATDIPGSRDLVTHEESGLLVPPEEPILLANAIQRMLEHPELRSRLGQAARRRVEGRYTLQHEVNDHVRLYQELLGISSE